MDPRENFFRILVSRLPTAALVIDRAGTIRYANPAAMAIFDAGCAGAVFSGLFGDPARCEAFIRSIVDGTGASASQSFEGEITGVAGETLHLQVDGVGAFDADGFDGVVLSVIDTTARQRREKRLIAEVTVDGLTGLGNRRAFDDQMKAFRRSGAAGSLAMLDVDRFKAVNDTYGHLAGDQILKTIAERLVKWLPETALLARMGGDEFVVLLAGAPLQDAKLRLTDMLERFTQPIVVGDASISFTISAGLTEWSAHPSDRILSDADIALYAAKSRGGNQVVTFGGDVRQVVQGRRLLADTVVRLNAENKVLMTEARTDVLTGLRNRRALADLEGLVLGSAECLWEEAAALFVDVDHFGLFNHWYGDSGGDDALRKMGRLLAAQARTSDLAFRKGGEEFVVLLPDVDPPAARSAAERVRIAVVDLAIPHQGSDTSPLLTVTIGVAWGGTGRSISQLITRAGDQAMRGKNLGQRNAVHTDLPGP